MAEQQHENNPAPSAPSPQPVIITDLAYLDDPHAAFATMRSGVDVIVEPTNGCARMTLSASLVSEVLLDE
jgi:hypothetical protein